MIELYTSPTPNGYKISVALEELEIPYNVHVVNLQSGDQKKPEFLSLNPNASKINLKKLNPGTYYVLFRNEEKTYRKKIIKM